MKKTILSALLPIFMATSAAFGTAMISYNDQGAGGGTATSGSYASTSSFSFDVNLTFTSPPTQVRGYSLWLEVPTALAPFISITSEQYFTFTNATSATPHAFNDTAGTDSGFMSETGDLGAITNLGNNETPVNPGAYHVSTLTFNLSGAPAGTYTLQSTVLSPRTSEASEQTTFTDFPFAQTQYVITVVPEPATLSLLALSGLGSVGLTMLRARRKG